MNLKKLYEGKAKILLDYNQTEIIQYFKDDITAFNGEKKEKLEFKGILANGISSILFTKLRSFGVANHFISKVSPREMLCKKLKIIPLEVVVRNVVAGSLCKRIGLKNGELLNSPIVEFYYKRDDLNDPLLNKNHINTLNIIDLEDLCFIEKIALKTNTLLRSWFLSVNLSLVDIKLEFGYDYYNSIVLGDEISPDTCRLWDINSNKILDKDRFRKDLGSVIDSYIEIHNRILPLA